MTEISSAVARQVTGRFLDPKRLRKFVFFFRPLFWGVIDVSSKFQVTRIQDAWTKLEQNLHAASHLYTHPRNLTFRPIPQNLNGGALVTPVYLRLQNIWPCCVSLVEFLGWGGCFLHGSSTVNKTKLDKIFPDMLLNKMDALKAPTWVDKKQQNQKDNKKRNIQENAK